MLYDDWRGYVVSLFALVWVANQYMSIYNQSRRFAFCDGGFVFCGTNFDLLVFNVQAKMCRANFTQVLRSGLSLDTVLFGVGFYRAARLAKP
jgi:hypothetical protein